MALNMYGICCYTLMLHIFEICICNAICTHYTSTVCVNARFDWKSCNLCVKWMHDDMTVDCDCNKDCNIIARSYLVVVIDTRCLNGYMPIISDYSFILQKIK